MKKMVDGVEADCSSDEQARILADWAAASCPRPSDVQDEAARRMQSFVFEGRAYDLGGDSLANIQSAGTLAFSEIMSGATAGDLRWSDPDEDFAWIAADNSLVKMDAQTCWAFAQTAMAHKSHVIRRARALKDMTPIPADYTSDHHWV